MEEIKKEFGSLKQMILTMLEKYPETRNSDNKLFIRICKELGAKTVDDISDMDVNLISVHKLRQVIQNKEGLFPPTDRVKKSRKSREVKIRNYMRKNNE